MQPPGAVAGLAADAVKRGLRLERAGRQCDCVTEDAAAWKVALMEFAYNTPEAAELRAFDTDLFPEYRLSEVMLGYSANCLVGLGAIPASRTLC